MPDIIGINQSLNIVGGLKLKEAIITNPQTTVYDASVLMTEKNSDSVIVVGQTGTSSMPDAMRKPVILGIVTVKDIVNRVIAKGLDTKKTMVTQVMTSPVQTASPDTPVYRIVLLMNQNNFRQIPVIDSDKVIGIVTSNVINSSLLTQIIDDLKVIVTIFK